MQTKQPQIAADTAAAVAYLRSSERWLHIGLHDRFLLWRVELVAAAGRRARAGGRGRLLRASGRGRDGSPGPAARASDFKCAILALMGGADQGIPQERSTVGAR